MTNHWIDLKNANVHLIMGSNAVENHPIASRWIWKAKEENNATIIHVDPRFTRTSAKADIYAPLRSGTDIAFLGGMIRWMIENWYTSGKKKYINKKYVETCTNALFKVRPDFKGARDIANLGDFSASSTWDYQYVLPHGAIWKPLKAANLDDAECVFQKLREHYSAYTPEMVERICGTPRTLFEQICEVYCGGTYKDDKAGTMLYAMGWTQHTVGTQNIRTASIIQTLLGNIGVAGGGVDALRGWHNVQGATDHGMLYHLLPGYNPAPKNIADHESLGTGPTTPNTYLGKTIPFAMDPDSPTNPSSGNWWSNRPKYVISNLRAWWPGVASATSWPYIPKIGNSGDANYSYLSLITAIKDASTKKGLFCWGTNPLVMGPDQNYERAAMDNLDWLVVCDLFETETATFWKRAGVNPNTIATEVFFLPGAYAYEKEGSAANSGRLAQWRDKACEPPGMAKDELEIIDMLGAEFKSGPNVIGDNQIAQLAWPVGPLLAAAGTLAEKVAKEINGYALSVFTVAAGTTVPPVPARTYAAGELVDSFFHLQTNDSTACGNWLFSGTWQAPGTLTPPSGNRMALRDPIDYHPAQIGIYHKWGYAWPVNRRIIYNRASVDQVTGAPLNPKKWVVWWNNTIFPSGADNASKWNGGCTGSQVNDVVDGYATNSPTTTLPFIMNEEGLARLMGTVKPYGTLLKDGPFPEHWEPKETPLEVNPLTGGDGTTLTGAPLISPYAYAYPGRSYAVAGDPNYPIVCTTYRLTEH
jgi:formate dehydrogenase major subunit